MQVFKAKRLCLVGLTALFVSALAGAGLAAEFTWAGGSKGNWSEVRNWTIGNRAASVCPSEEDEVIIPYSANISIDKDVSIAKLTVKEKASSAVFYMENTFTTEDLRVTGATAKLVPVGDSEFRIRPKNIEELLREHNSTNLTLVTGAIDENNPSFWLAPPSMANYKPRWSLPGPTIPEGELKVPSKQIPKVKVLESDVWFEFTVWGNIVCKTTSQLDNLCIKVLQAEKLDLDL